MANNNKTLLCEICCAVFTKKSNLNRHTKNVHFAERTFLCEHCSKSYITKSSLVRHITSTHFKLTTKQCTTWQCPICIFESEKETMVEHYQTVHKIDTTSTNMVFDCFDHFQNWKQNIQHETCSKCHRDGFYKGKGNNIRRLKKVGSNKINGHCPAKIEVNLIVTTGSVSIKYVKSHVGHEMEPFRLSVIKADRNFVTKKISVEKSSEICRETSIIEEIPDNKISIHTYTKEFSDTLKENGDSKVSIKKLEEVKNALVDKFQLILQKINYLDQCDIVEKQLSNIYSNLNNYETSNKSLKQ